MILFIEGNKCSYSVWISCSLTLHLISYRVCLLWWWIFTSLRHFIKCFPLHINTFVGRVHLLNSASWHIIWRISISTFVKSTDIYFHFQKKAPSLKTQNTRSWSLTLFKSDKLIIFDVHPKKTYWLIVLSWSFIKSEAYYMYIVFTEYSMCY